MSRSGIRSAGSPESVSVIGAGLMGHGIAQAFAQGGCNVTLHDTDQTALKQAKEKIRLNLKALAERGLEEEGRVDEIVSRISLTGDLAEAVRGADFVVEAVPEDLLIKRETFNAIDALAPEGAVLASNTSMLTMSDIGKDVKEKRRLVVTHWFNPPYLIPVVEVVKGALTSQDTMERTIHLLEKIGKLPVRILKEVPGHLLNRIQFALFRETLSLLQEGVATPEEIDKAVSGSLGLRLATIGPLKSIDLAGIDLFWFGMKNMYSYLDNSLEPQRIIQEKVRTGDVGRKSGKGFFEYESAGLLSKDEKARDDKIMELLTILYPKQET
ncbi:MAG: 3-hydroxyacyl-CoA dehydrogenase family protein [Desulfomonilaceae bacterium]